MNNDKNIDLSQSPPKKPKWKPYRRSAITERVLACTPGHFPWDDWEKSALAAGVSQELATLGRATMREASQHGWPYKLKVLCGWRDNGQRMIRLALRSPETAKERWNGLFEAERRGELY